MSYNIPNHPPQFAHHPAPPKRKPFGWIAAAVIGGSGLVLGSCMGGVAGAAGSSAGDAAPAATVTVTATTTKTETVEKPGPTKTVTAPQPERESFTVSNDTRAVMKGDLDGSAWIVTPGRGATCSWGYGVAGVGGVEGFEQVFDKSATLLLFPDGTDAVAFVAEGGTCEWERIS